MSASIRRHHIQRLKKKRRYYWGRDLNDDPKRLSMVTTTPQTCSCMMCGNCRKHAGKSIQERKHEGYEGF